MKSTKPPVDTKSFDIKLKDYSKLSKSLLLRPFKNPQSLLPLGAAFLAGIPSGEAAIIYSGVQNVGCALAANTNRCYANINNAGGNDLEFHRNHVTMNQLIQIDEVPGGGFEINGFHAKIAGAYDYPYADAAGVVIGAAGPWGFNSAGQANTMSELNNNYPNDAWTPLANGTTRFVGLRGTVGGLTRYGWLRITKNGFGNYTLVDWAYNNTGGSIQTGQTLPVELMSFDYRLNANNLQLTWRTASEANNAGFEVERSEEDGKNFNSIDWVDGHGTSSVFNDYYYDDKNLREGKTYYYRLRQVDYNGQFDLSSVLSVSVGGDATVVGEFYPSPSKAQSLYLDFTASTDAEWSATVFDVLGKAIRQEQIFVVKGQNNLQFDFMGMTAGTYFVKLQNGNERVFRKLVIED